MKSQRTKLASSKHGEAATLQSVNGARNQSIQTIEIPGNSSNLMRWGGKSSGFSSNLCVGAAKALTLTLNSTDIEVNLLPLINRVALTYLHTYFQFAELTAA